MQAKRPTKTKKWDNSPWSRDVVYREEDVDLELRLIEQNGSIKGRCVG